jgi:hypothetical protein
MKLNFMQTHEAFGRAVRGESVRSIARGMAVTEGALRFHFRKSTHSREVRRIAFDLFHVRQAVEQLSSRMDQMTPARRAELTRMAQSMGADMQ